MMHLELIINKRVYNIDAVEYCSDTESAVSTGTERIWPILRINPSLHSLTMCFSRRLCQKRAETNNIY